MAVATSPYAKMCDAIVKEAMKGEIGHSLGLQINNYCWLKFQRLEFQRFSELEGNCRCGAVEYRWGAGFRLLQRLEHLEHLELPHKKERPLTSIRSS